MKLFVLITAVTWWVFYRLPKRFEVTFLLSNSAWWDDFEQKKNRQTERSKFRHHQVQRGDMNRVSFDQCKTHDSATLDLIKSAKQPGGAKRFVDRHDSNGYWICSGANCMKYCRKPFALMRSENTITRRRCEKSTDGYKWSDAESAPARCEKEGFSFWLLCSIFMRFWTKTNDNS